MIVSHSPGPSTKLQGVCDQFLAGKCDWLDLSTVSRGSKDLLFGTPTIPPTVVSVTYELLLKQAAEDSHWIVKRWLETCDVFIEIDRLARELSCDAEGGLFNLITLVRGEDSASARRDAEQFNDYLSWSGLSLGPLPLDILDWNPSEVKKQVKKALEIIDYEAQRENLAGMLEKLTDIVSAREISRTLRFTTDTIQQVAGGRVLDQQELEHFAFLLREAVESLKWIQDALEVVLTCENDMNDLSEPELHESEATGFDDFESETAGDAFDSAEEAVGISQNSADQGDYLLSHFLSPHRNMLQQGLGELMGSLETLRQLVSSWAWEID